MKKSKGGEERKGGKFPKEEEKLVLLSGRKKKVMTKGRKKKERCRYAEKRDAEMREIVELCHLYNYA